MNFEVTATFHAVRVTHEAALLPNCRSRALRGHEYRDDPAREPRTSPIAKPWTTCVSSGPSRASPTATCARATPIALLRDSRENYPAWLEAIRSAQTVIHFENFIIADDETGRAFADALIERARAGRAVRVLYDWLGSSFRALPRFWRAPARGRASRSGSSTRPG